MKRIPTKLSNLFTRLSSNTTAEHEFFARSVDVMSNEYTDEKNKQNLLNYFAKRFMIERGLAPLPPDPRENK